MSKPYNRWIEFLYGPFFRIIGFFYRVYTANRARVERLKANAKVAGFLKLLAFMVLFGWFLIWYFASDEHRNRLTDEVRQTIGGFNSGSAD